MDPTSATVVGEAALKVFEFAEKQGFLDKLINIFRKKHKILILGSTGTGKTNLLLSLTEEAPKAIDHMNRTEFSQKHSLKINNEPFIFVDTPGQIESKPRRMSAIRDAVKEVSGIINVVSYGYHEWKLGKTQAIHSDESVSQDYLLKHRNIEIELLSEWTPILGGPETASWLITVITKADLWWNQKEEVFNHYTRGEYYESLGDAKSLKPVVIEYCSVFHKFYGEGRLSGLFDEGDRTRSRANLLKTLFSAVGKEALK